MAIYTSKNKLKLNLDKTKFIHFSINKIPLNVFPSLKQVLIDKVTSFKYLGFEIDEKLSMKKITNHLCMKLRQCSGALNRFKQFLSKDLFIVSCLCLP